MATPFEKIYDKFFLFVGDDVKLRFFKLSAEDMNDLLYATLEESITYFTTNKEIQKKINIVTQNFDLDLTLDEISVLANGMVLIWIQPQILRLQNLRQSLGDRDFKISSNWQTLNSLLSLQEASENRLKTKVLNYSYKNIKEKLLEVR